MVNVFLERWWYLCVAVTPQLFDILPGRSCKLIDIDITRGPEIVQMYTATYSQKALQHAGGPKAVTDTPISGLTGSFPS